MTRAARRRRGPGPLWRHAVTRLLERSAWPVLVLIAFVAVAMSAASGPMFGEAAGNAALRTALEAVPDNATASQAAVVRLTGGESPLDPAQGDSLEALQSIPGLSDTHVVGGSIGAELALDARTRPRPVVVVGSLSAPARLYAVEDPETALVPARGWLSDPASSGRAGVWLPAPLAERLHVSPGDEIKLTLERIPPDDPTEPVPPPPVATTTVNGIYAVAADGHVPADPAGTTEWVRRSGELPASTEFLAGIAPLLVTDIATAQDLADASGDKILWTVEARLDPDATLSEAELAVTGVQSLRTKVHDPGGLSSPSGPLRLTVVSGLSDLVAAADNVAAATRARAATLANARILLGWLTIISVALLGIARRRVELAHAAGSGIGPVRIAGLAFVEHAIAAAIGIAAGSALGLVAVLGVGPSGQVTLGAMLSGLERAAAVVGVGLVLVAGVAAAAGVSLARPTTSGRVRRPLPWVSLLVAAAATATIGSASIAIEGARARGLDLVVPLLVTAAVGAVGARAAVFVVRRVLRGRTREAGAAAPIGRTPRRIAWWLALRRLSAPGDERVVVMTAMAAGFGLLLFALVTAESTRVSIDDRIAVAAGASATSDIALSYLVDDLAAQAEPVEEGLPIPDVGDDPVPGVRTPPLPDGLTMVWRAKATIPSEFGYRDLLVVDPSTFSDVAEWGRGADLRHIRGLLDELLREDASTTSALDASRNLLLPVPVIAINDDAVTVGEIASLSTVGWTLPVHVIAAADAFPGYGSGPMFVAAAPSMFGQLSYLDPRVIPPEGNNLPPPTPPEAYLWSARGPTAISDFLNPRGVIAVRSTTALEIAQRPILVAAGRALGYQLALGGYLALLGLVALALFADRSAARLRPTDLLLARVGLGRRGVRAARRAELVGLVAVPLVCACISVSLLRPLAARLLDPQPGAAPPFRLDLDGPSVLITAGFAAVAGVLALFVAARAGGARGSAGGDEAVLRVGE